VWGRHHCVGRSHVARYWTAVDEYIFVGVIKNPASRLGKYRYRADGTMPRSRATARSESTAAPLTQREMVGALCDAAGRDHVKVKGLPRMALRMTGVVSPTVRELVEIAYQFEAPFVIDSSAATSEFGIEPTPISGTAAATIRFASGAS